MNSNVSSLFPLPPDFPASETLHALKKSPNPEEELKSIFNDNPDQQFKFLFWGILASFNSPEWFQKNSSYFNRLHVNLISTSDFSSNIVTHESLTQKKRIRRIEELFELIKAPQKKFCEILTRKKQECLHSFITLVEQAHLNQDIKTLNHLRQIFRSHPSVKDVINSKKFSEDPCLLLVQKNTIIRIFGSSKEFQSLTKEASITYSEDFHYTLLKLPSHWFPKTNISPPPHAFLIATWEHITGLHDFDQLKAYLSSEPDTLLELGRACIDFSTPTEWIYQNQPTINHLIQCYNDFSENGIDKELKQELNQTNKILKIKQLFATDEIELPPRDLQEIRWQHLNAYHKFYEALKINDPFTMIQLVKLIPPLKKIIIQFSKSESMLLEQNRALIGAYLLAFKNQIPNDKGKDKDPSSEDDSMTLQQVHDAFEQEKKFMKTDAWEKLEKEGREALQAFRKSIDIQEFTEGGLEMLIDRLPKDFMDSAHQLRKAGVPLSDCLRYQLVEHEELMIYYFALQRKRETALLELYLPKPNTPLEDCDLAFPEEDINIFFSTLSENPQWLAQQIHTYTTKFKKNNAIEKLRAILVFINGNEKLCKNIKDHLKLEESQILFLQKEFKNEFETLYQILP